MVSVYILLLLYWPNFLYDDQSETLIQNGLLNKFYKNSNSVFKEMGVNITPSLPSLQLWSNYQKLIHWLLPYFTSIIRLLNYMYCRKKWQNLNQKDLLTWKYLILLWNFSYLRTRICCGIYNIIVSKALSCSLSKIYLTFFFKNKSERVKQPILRINLFQLILHFSKIRK